MADLTDLTLQQAVDSIRQGKISSRELTQAFLDRIERVEPELHAFITVSAGKALEMADAADQKLAALRRVQDAEIPPLLGVPMAIKDVLCVEDVRCTCGSKILENFVPPFNATVVERLQNAGVVFLGKTNTDEFAMGSSTENSAYGVTHNPWNLDHVPGGSSGGSAADAAKVFEIVAGHDPRDATSMDLPVQKIALPNNGSLKDLRIGVPKEYFIAGIQAEVRDAVEQAIETLRGMGAQVKEISLPHTEYALPVYYLIAPAEASANLARYDGIRYGPRISGDAMWDIFFNTRGQKFGAEVKRRIMLGTYALSAGYYDAYYGQAQKVRTLIKRDFETIFESVDVVAAPVAPTTAFRIGDHTDDPLAMYLEDVFTLPANLAGVPGLAFPVGFDRAGLPVGMQLMGPHFREDILFQAAHAYQLVTDWHDRKPAL